MTTEERQPTWPGLLVTHPLYARAPVWLRTHHLEKKIRTRSQGGCHIYAFRIKHRWGSSYDPVLPNVYLMPGL